jgi:hypothetical protein
MPDACDLHAKQIAEAVRANLGDVLAGEALGISVSAAAKKVHRREAVVREAVASGEIAAWDGVVSVASLREWFERKCAEEAASKRPSLRVAR